MTGILLTGVTGATVGGASPSLGNTEADSFTGAGMVVGGPGTECEYTFGNSCAPNGGNTEQFSSTGDNFENNSFTGNGAGTLVEGSYDPPIVGPSDPDAAYGNTFSDNSWSFNAIANVADFSGYGPTTAPSNSYGPGDSCEPVEGGSPSLDGFTGVQGVIDVTLTSGSPTATVTSGGFPNVTSGMGVIDVTTPANIAASTTVSSVGSNTLTLSANAAGNSTGSGDTLYFGNFYAC